ncbi:hypothetical protein PINS_up022398 [Pythium insidiosum]|nr:hypothetical protein PINS_up022398 [Pythium insidiosum]
MRSRTPKKEWFCRECVGQVVVGPPRRHNWADSDNYSTPSSARSDVSPATSDPPQEPFSVRSDKESKLYEMDVEALAELAQQWSINDNNTRGLLWNAEELARLSDRLNSSRVKRHAEAQSKQKVSLPVPKTKTSRLAALFGRKKGSSRSHNQESDDEDEDDAISRERADTNWVPGNSYSGGACDWRANAMRLNAAVADPFADALGPDERAPTVDSTYMPTAHDSRPPAAPRSAPHARQRIPTPPHGASLSDDELKRLYAHFMDTMARNRAAREQQSGAPRASVRGERPSQRPTTNQGL